MSPLVHALIAWLLAIAFLRTSSDRRLAVIAGVAPDLDGVFILFSQVLFLTYHHTFGHSYVFGLPVALAAAVLGHDRLRTGLVALGAFSLHLGADIVGNDWPIPPLYPFSGVSFSVRGVLSGEVVYAVIDPIVAVAVIGLVLVVMYRREVSPFEFFSERLDRWFVSRWVYPFKRRCQVCGKRALGPCGSCGRAMCPDHMRGFLRSRCPDCAGAAKA